jgi:hypothetical protein
MRQLEFIGQILGIGRILGSAAVAWTLAAAMSTAESKAAPDATAPTPAPTPSDAVPVAWQHHRGQFSYVGQTTLYSCTGLEDKVRDILLFLGARNDLTVRAQGCPDISAPSHLAWVRVEFDTLAPLDGNPAGASAMAQWVPFSITARRPRFMDEGDCELVQAMKDVIAKEFGLQHLDYRVRCFPHALSSDDFAITGNALRMQSGAMTQARLKPLGN